MAILKKHGKTGRHKGATKAARPKDRQAESAHTEEEPSEGGEAEVVDDDDESYPLVGGVAGALIGGVAGLVIGGVLGAMAEAFKSAVDDDEDDDDAEEYDLPRPLGSLYLRFPVRSFVAYFRSKPKAWHIESMNEVFLDLLFSCA